MSAESRAGFVAPALAQEFAGLGLRYVVCRLEGRRRSAAVRKRLRMMSDRINGAEAIQLRNRPIPWAYRVFFRHIGIDPDHQRTPVEELFLARLQHGGFKSEDRLSDALTIGVVETSVALRAFDAEALTGALGIRASAPGESLAGRPGELPGGTLVIADEQRPVGLLFGATASSVEVDRGTRSVAIVAIRVPNVPDIALEEALWLASEALRG